MVFPDPNLRQVRPRFFPFKPRKGFTFPLGSCHGTLALGSQDGNLDFWNPTTNQCYSTSLAPDHTRALNRISTRSVLYHDTCSNQYKLVQAVGVGGICEFQSYNLEANGFTTFHTLPDIDDHVCHSLRSRRTLSCFVNGALHWLVPRSGDGFRSEIVALHLETLECYKLPLVQYRYCEPTLVVFGGLLCATFSNCRDGGTRYDIDVWVMKEYGGEWTRLFNLITPEPHKYVYPIAYSKNRDKVLLHFFSPWDSLEWYHLKQEKLIPVNIPGAPQYPFQAILFLPSLVNYQS
ncbi:hypothetical protein Tsubulata_044219, partial [Turnera subulata]